MELKDQDMTTKHKHPTLQFAGRHRFPHSWRQSKTDVFCQVFWQSLSVDVGYRYGLLAAECVSPGNTAAGAAATLRFWIPAFAGMTARLVRHEALRRTSNCGSHASHQAHQNTQNRCVIAANAGMTQVHHRPPSQVRKGGFCENLGL